MRKLILLLAVAYLTLPATAQNPATVFTIPNKHIVLPCGTGCTAINVSVPHIKQTNNYVITNPAYIPYAYTTPGGNELTSVYIDDTWSPKIPLPFAFSFCFFGINYPTLVVGSNSIISFDTTLAGNFNEWDITGPLPNTSLEGAAIFGPMHDINPADYNNPPPTQRKIEWRVEGVAPKRRFIASYNDVAFYGSTCNTNKATHQMVIYENTGIIEVYIHNKPYCLDWNNGRAILGLQNKTKNFAVTAPGKNATPWGMNNMDSCFRFIPSSGSSMFKRAELLVNNVVVSTTTTDTTTGGPGVLNVNFPNVCPTADSTAYIVRVVYGSCSNPALELSFSDTVFVKKNTLASTAAKTDANCTTNGTITVTATGGIAPLQFSINGGVTYQNSNVFTNVQPGTYNVVTRDASLCTINQTIVIALQGAITVNAGVDTTLCFGASFTRNAVSAGTTYSWSPSTGVSNPSIANPVFTPQSTTTYTVTASTGNCTAQDAFVVTVFPGATANAGPDAIIIAGDIYTMHGTGSSGSYLWTPSAGLSASNILNPSASPSQTTTYTLKVTTSQGCVAADSIVITVVPYCVKPMEAFTPNGDGINDVWLVTNGTGCLDKAKAEVYNRYGAKVFEAENYQNNWDGTYKGKPLPDGTYYFVITYRLINGKDQYLKGNVTILR
ncbi:MAG: gliding motility-associated C-terminal domain-containing protein [Bacteroidota bacterium]|nr:gliding motility-associated C-terminal domain-containing protein [Bacteroidota bacterium]